MSLTPEERVRRGQIVRKHVMIGLLTLLVLIAVNALFSSRYPWWLWVLIAWMPLVAGHTAWAMGMFERKKEGS
ncbi:MAG: 2TM domain-containing protein [Reyranella sp.]|nr:MAG: 2TM domain-containing protein [Reyranella sp.]